MRHLRNNKIKKIKRQVSKIRKRKRIRVKWCEGKVFMCMCIYRCCLGPTQGCDNEKDPVRRESGTQETAKRSAGGLDRDWSTTVDGTE